MAIVQLGDVVQKILGNEDRLTTSLEYYVGGEHFTSGDLEIKQFDECFSVDAWCIKRKDADAMVFTYPDLLVTPDITVGNAIWKSLTILNNWYAKGYVIGGKLISILLSRSDSEESYYESIKGACNEN